MKERRKNNVTFNVLIDKKHGEDIENYLKETNQTKVSWLIKKIEQDTKK